MPAVKRFIGKQGWSALRKGLNRQNDHHLAEEIENLSLGLLLKLFALLGIALGFAIIVSPVRPIAFKILYYLAFLVVVVFPFVTVMRGSVKRFLGFNAGHYGEGTTGEALSRLMDHGYFVYHRLATKAFAIDHVVIGPAGVFAVQTISRARLKETGSAGDRVRVEGSKLIFPDDTDESVLPLARKEARRLFEFLREAVQDDIPVFPVVALPGWSIEGGGWISDGRSRCLVFNPRGAMTFIAGGGELLKPDLVKELAFKVQQRSRTTEPDKALPLDGTVRDGSGDETENADEDLAALSGIYCTDEEEDRGRKSNTVEFRRPRKAI